MVKNSSVIDLNNLFDNNLKSILKAEKGVFGVFFPYLLLFALVAAVCIFLNFKGWLMVFTFLMLTVYGYIFGYNVAIMVVLFDTIGLLNAIIIIIPIELCISLVLLVIASIAIYRCYIIKKYGCAYYQKCCWLNINKIYFWWVICGVVLVLLKSILFGVIRITIIV